MRRAIENVILVILIVALVVLYFLGRRLQKKQAASQEQMEAAKQTVSMLVIDKKMMRLKEAGLPQIVIDQTPKLMRRSKVPIVKAKVGKKHVLYAMHPLTHLANGTLEEACDKVKEYLDILAPGGKYIFNMDKSVLRGRQIDWNKLNPWLDCIHTYGKY